jgi:hypothetical protein
MHPSMRSQKAKRKTSILNRHLDKSGSRENPQSNEDFFSYAESDEAVWSLTSGGMCQRNSCGCRVVGIRIEGPLGGTVDFAWLADVRGQWLS